MKETLQGFMSREDSTPFMRRGGKRKPPQWEAMRMVRGRRVWARLSAGGTLTLRVGDVERKTHGNKLDEARREFEYACELAGGRHAVS